MRPIRIASALLSAALPLAVLVGCGAQNSPLSDSGSATEGGNAVASGAASSDPWDSVAAGISNPTAQEFALLKASCLVPGIPMVDNGPLLPMDSAALAAREAPSPNAALAARMGVPEAAIYLNTDLEGEDPGCWDNRLSGFNRAGCGKFKGIGSFPIALSTAGIAHSGSKAIRITYAANEEAGGSNVGVNSDTVNVRAYYYFDQGFDFGQGMKIGRVQSFNESTQMNDVDVILQCRSVNGANQCGVTDMAQLGLHYNGRPVGSDWGAVSANVSFQRNRWYAVEYQVILNTPGMSDGIGRMWVDGKLVGERTNLRIRGNFGTGVKLNTVRVGGWYSNSARGNSCPNPSQPSRIYMDDVVIAKGYIGPEPETPGTALEVAGSAE